MKKKERVIAIIDERLYPEQAEKEIKKASQKYVIVDTIAFRRYIDYTSDNRSARKALSSKGASSFIAI